jgi:hypothetical protein
MNERQKRNFRRAFWKAANYEPTTGEFPIHDLEGKLVTESYGQAAIHEDDSRIKQIAGGVRAGKSKVSAMDSPEDMLVDDGLMWIVGPDYEQGKAEFRYIFQALSKLGVIEGKASMPERGPQTLTTTWGFRVQTKSGADLISLASFAPDKILVVEANQQPEEILSKAAERALEKNARIILSGTLEKSYPWFAEKWEEWQGENPEGAASFSLPSWSNTYIFPGGRRDKNILALEAILPAEEFLERCAAIPCKVSGLVFKEVDRKRHVRRVDFNPELPVELAIDPATATYAVLAIQWEELSLRQYLAKWELTPKTPPTTAQLDERRTWVYVIDEIYTHDKIAQEVIPIVKERPWFKFVKYGVIDIAGSQRVANKSQIQIWAEETGISLNSNYVFIEDSIDVVTLRLKGETPILTFDYRLRSDKADGGKANGLMAEFGLYKWPEWKEGHSERRKPIDANNHSVKALGYWIYHHFGPVKERKKRAKAKIRSYY